MSTSARIWALPALVFLLGAGCAGEDPLAPAPTRPPARVAEDLFVIDESEGGIALYDIGEGRLELDYRWGPVPAPGDVIAGTARGGFIRRARTVRRQGSRVTVSTMPAFLTSAIVTGYVDTTLAAGFSTEGLLLDGIELLPSGEDTQGSSILIEHGWIGFDPTVAFRLAIFGGRMTSMGSGVSGPLSLEMELFAHLAGPLSWSGRTELATVRRTLDARIGPVPVPLTVITRIAFEMTVSASSAGECAWRYEATHEIDADLRLDGSWRMRPGFSWTPSESPAISRTEGTDCCVEIAVVCETEISLFAAEAEPGHVSFEMRPAAVLDVATEEWPWWSWTLTGGMSVESAAQAGVLDPFAPAPTLAAKSDTSIAGSGPFHNDSYIFVDEWDGGADRLSQPRGLAVGPGGLLYVSDQGDHRIVVFGPDGDVVDSWGGYGTAGGYFIFPAGVAVDRGGNVWVCDSGNSRVQEFAPDGSFIAAWGTVGTGPGEFIQPEGIATGDDTLIAVCDGGTGDVVLLGASGNEIGRWSNGLSRGVAFDDAGGLYVAGCPASSVTKYSLSGELLDRWESDGNGEPRFDCPIDVAVDRSGSVLVLEFGACRFTALSADGATLSTLGGCGSGPGQFDRPGGIAVSDDGWVYVADTYNGRVQVFAPRPPEQLSRRARR